MDDDVQNANPTILNPSDLPSRRRESLITPRKDGGSGLLDGTLPSYTYPYTAFPAPSSRASDSSGSLLSDMEDTRYDDHDNDEDEEEEEEEEEEIDAQEIYGEL